MRLDGFIGPSYTLLSSNFDCQRCINLYPEINEIGSGKEREIASLRGTPGLKTLLTLPKFPVRGEYTSSSGRVFAVGGNKLYEISSAWVATEIATLTTNVGQVSMADNGIRLVIVDGSTSGFMFNFSTAAVTSVPFPTEINFQTFTGCDQVAYIDGYFIFNHKDHDSFFISGKLASIIADDTTIDALEFAVSEGSPDKIVGILAAHQNLWVFGEESIEIFYDSGNPDFPFERTQGAFIENGLAAKFSFAKVDESVVWLGRSKKGAGIVYRAQGYQPQRISTHAVEQAIQKYADITDAVAYSYQEDGHHFYVLNFPTANATWVFDTTTSLWHERAFLNQGKMERHRANCHTYGFGKHIVGDYATGKIYEMSSSYYSDDGVEIIRRRTAPHITKGLVRLFYNSIQLDLETGTGLDGIGQGTDPQVMLRFSDDGGHSWSNEKWTSFGKIGQTKKRAKWNRLGASRDRVFEITITDPVKVVIIGAEVDLVQGAN